MLIFRPHLLCEKCWFVCTTIILYSRPNWHALVKSCISVNHYVLQLYVSPTSLEIWFTKFTKFWGEVKNGPSVGISKKAFSFRGEAPNPLPPIRGGVLPLDDAGSSAPDPERSPSSKFATTPLGITGRLMQPLVVIGRLINKLAHRHIHATACRK